MKRKVFLLLIVFLMIFSLVACNNKGNNNENDNPDNLTEGLTLEQQVGIIKDTYTNIMNTEKSAAVSIMAIADIKPITSDMPEDDDGFGLLLDSIFDGRLVKYKHDFRVMGNTAETLGYHEDKFYLFSTTILSLIDEYGEDSLFYNYKVNYNELSTDMQEEYAQLHWTVESIKEVNIAGVEKDGEKYNVYATFYSEISDGRTAVYHIKTYFNSADDYGIELLCEWTGAIYTYASFDKSTDLSLYLGDFSAESVCKLHIRSLTIGKEYGNAFCPESINGGIPVMSQEDFAYFGDFFTNRTNFLTQVVETLEDENIEKNPNANPNSWSNLNNNGKKKKNIYEDHVTKEPIICTIDFDYALVYEYLLGVKSK